MAERAPLIAINEGVIDGIFDQQQLTVFELFELFELIKAESTRRTTHREISDNIQLHATPRHRR